MIKGLRDRPMDKTGSQSDSGFRLINHWSGRGPTNRSVLGPQFSAFYRSWRSPRMVRP